MRTYQACQDAAGDFELRVDCSAEFFEQLRESVRIAFATAVEGQIEAPGLSIVRTQQFIAGKSNKFEDFISAFTPEMDS